jgi:hypothetical protein
MILSADTLNCSGDAAGPDKLPLSTVIAPVTGELLAGIRRPAGRNETGVIGAPYRVEKTS